MSDIHLTADILRAVARGQMTTDELTQLVLNHLVHLCPTCRTELDSCREEPGGEVLADSDFDGLFRRLESQAPEVTSVLERERERAEQDFRTLQKIPAERREQRILRATRRFRSPFLVARLIEECRKSLPDSSDLGFEYAQLAKQIAASLPDPLRQEFRALALAHQANALRAAGELAPARDRMERARNVVRAEGVTDTLVVAEVDWIEGALDRDQQHFRSSESLLLRATKLFEIGGDPIRAASVLLSLGELYRDVGKLDYAIKVLDRAERSTELRTRPRLALCALHNRLTYLVEAGRFAEARQGLCERYERYQEFPDSWTQLRLTWLEAKIDAGLGYLDQAVESYKATREGFLRDGKGYDAAIVSLELATVLLEIGRTQEVRQVAREIAATFETQDVHREAIAALLLFQQAAEAEKVTKKFLGNLTRYLEQARRDPSLRFRKPS